MQSTKDRVGYGGEYFLSYTIESFWLSVLLGLPYIKTLSWLFIVIVIITYGAWCVNNTQSVAPFVKKM